MKRIPLDKALDRLADEYLANLEGNNCIEEEWLDTFGQSAEVVSEGEELLLEIDDDE
jgi:hypothetical protein